MSKILLVEPDHSLARTIAKSLGLNNHQVSISDSAQSAIHQADKFDPDVIILELQLPVHNGIEFLYELRSYGDWNDVPVIIYSQISPTQKAISPMLWDQLNIAAYHYKPLTKLANLSDTIDQVLAIAP